MAIHTPHVAEPLDEPITSVTTRSALALVGRILIAAIFLLSGIAKLVDNPGTVGHMTAAGIPAADILSIIAGVAEILGGLALLLGWFTRAGALGLILFMIPATLIFHGFWSYQGAEQKTQMVNFMKNLAIIGGLAQIMAFGAGRFSVDARRMHRRLHHAK